MKLQTISAITLFGALIINATTVEASPLVYTESTRTELQKAYDNRDMELVALEYADIEIERFCRNSNAHTSNEQWEVCVSAIEGLVLRKKMIRLAEISEMQDYSVASQGRY